MREGQKRISVYLPIELYTEIENTECTMTEAIIKGLELFLEPGQEIGTNIPENEPTPSHELLTGYQSIIENLEDQLKAKDNIYLGRIEDLKEQLKVKDSQVENRVMSLEEQLKVKDSQLESKDSQLEKQAVHIQTLINQKAIEAPGAKKPWWRFW